MLRDDAVIDEDLHARRAAAHLDVATDVFEGHGVLALLEVHRAVAMHRPDHADVEGLWQQRQRPQRQQQRRKQAAPRGGGPRPSATFYPCRLEAGHPMLCAPPTGEAEPERALLPFRRIRDLALDGVDLVVLSACRSATGPSARGAPLRGLAWAFLQAGAAQVLASREVVADLLFEAPTSLAVTRI